MKLFRSTDLLMHLPMAVAFMSVSLFGQKVVLMLVAKLHAADRVEGSIPGAGKMF